jgi:hypothetical protein
VSLFKNFFNRSQRRERRRKEARLRALTPATSFSDDTYLVSFPKAGVTWLAFLIANTNLLLTHDQRQATCWNIHDFIPDIHTSRHLSNPILAGVRFIKSHSEFHPDYHKVIYLVRDPRATLASYYDMATKLNWFSGSMDEFLASEKLGVDAWVRHLDGWINQRGTDTRINFIRYEDLKKNPLDVLERLYRLFGLTVERTILETAVARSSFAHMKADEDFYKELSFDPHNTFKFMRKGEANAFSGELSPAQITFIENKTGDWMKLFKYEFAGTSTLREGK